MAREAGAKNVYFASAAPEIRFPNVYGIDMPSAAELIAHGRAFADDLFGRKPLPCHACLLPQPKILTFNLDSF